MGKFINPGLLYEGSKIFVLIDGVGKGGMVDTSNPSDPLPKLHGKGKTLSKETWRSKCPYFNKGH